MQNLLISCITISTLPLVTTILGHSAQAAIRPVDMNAHLGHTEIYNQGDDREGFPGDLVGGGTRYNICGTDIKTVYCSN
ncbi:hypothetical protein Lepto7376_3539 [[Leptolyngbya] sp. PCC 7376]|nr:hypothetical protein Lepto7376_3539 [[Leptolyngbya] sp. PCC 7376]